MRGSRNMCNRCGTLIVKSGFADPYTCRWCEVETDFGSPGSSGSPYSNLDRA